MPPTSRPTKPVRVYADMDAEVDRLMVEYERNNKQDFYDEIFSCARLYWTTVQELGTVPNWRSMPGPKRRRK